MESNANAHTHTHTMLAHTRTHSHRYSPLLMKARRLPNKDCTPNSTAQKVQTPDKDAPKCKGSQPASEQTTELQGRIRAFTGCSSAEARKQGRSRVGSWPMKGRKGAAWLARHSRQTTNRRRCKERDRAPHQKFSGFFSSFWKQFRWCILRTIEMTYLISIM